MDSNSACFSLKPLSSCRSGRSSAVAAAEVEHFGILVNLSLLHHYPVEIGAGFQTITSIAETPESASLTGLFIAQEAIPLLRCVHSLNRG